ncbi:predicted protein [Aspergillus terreus NIH2624]|uniref:Uncharacterized protein n=1 Tax=Aspergillus terreus (strain NIH 2624 / FGSC A1156) TaxID=341663 RepID=Q0D229_ASPTN|nr:uncharacterized protein ATEG_00005 [Aspergillus terreus NIH2624]EAU38651.1 predicted protein [Aspergillus terreus NIH2624]
MYASLIASVTKSGRMHFRIKSPCSDDMSLSVQYTPVSVISMLEDCERTRQLFQEDSTYPERLYKGGERCGKWCTSQDPVTVRGPPRAPRSIFDREASLSTTDVNSSA